MPLDKLEAAVAVAVEHTEVGHPLLVGVAMQTRVLLAAPASPGIMRALVAVAVARPKPASRQTEPIHQTAATESHPQSPDLL